MASNSEFAKFKRTLNPTNRSLGAALAPREEQAAKEEVVSREEVAPREEISTKTTNPDKKQVSHYMDRGLLESLGVLKARSGKSMSTLYEEAIIDLLEKYNVK